eukprot:1381826-Amphidinium_carterae.1
MQVQFDTLGLFDWLVDVGGRGLGQNQVAPIVVTMWSFPNISNLHIWMRSMRFLHLAFFLETSEPLLRHSSTSAHGTKSIRGLQKL